MILLPGRFDAWTSHCRESLSLGHCATQVHVFSLFVLDLDNFQCKSDSFKKAVRQGYREEADKQHIDVELLRSSQLLLQSCDITVID